MPPRTVPGELDPAEFPWLPREQLLDAMSCPLREVFEEVEQCVFAEELAYLRALHTLGRAVLRIDPVSGYDRRAIELVAAACGGGPSHLQRAARFATLFPDLSVVERLVTERQEAGYRFTMEHVLQLLPVFDPAVRARLIDDAVLDRMTAREFGRHVYEELGSGRRERAPSVYRPTTLWNGFNTVTLMATKVRVQLQDNLPECVIARLAELPPDRITETYFDRISALREELDLLAVEAADAAADLVRAGVDLARRVSEAVVPASDEFDGTGT